MQQVIYDELSKRGYKARVMSVSYLNQLRQNIEDICADNCLSENL